MILGKLCEYISEKCNGANAKRKLEDQKHYNIIKEGLNESMLNINKAIENIGNWDELMNIKEQLPESIQIQRSKTIEYKYKETKCFFYYIWDNILFNSFNRSSSKYNYFKFFI